MNLHKITKLLLPLLMVLGLAACSGNANDYNANQSQDSLSSIQVPGEYAITNMEQDYPIPDVVTDKSANKVSSIDPPKDAT
jgi:uncharacterized lipoprotein